MGGVTKSPLLLLLTESSWAELVEESKRKLGEMSLDQAAEHYPIDARRVWTIKYPRSYTVGSEVMLCFLVARDDPKNNYQAKPQNKPYGSQGAEARGA